MKSKKNIIKKHIYQEIKINLFIFNQEYFYFFIAFLSGIACFSLGTLAIVGWHTNSPSLYQFQLGLTPMYYNTAVCFVVLGVGLIILLSPYKRGISLMGIVLMTFAGLTLAQYIFNLNFGIDQLFFKTPISLHTSSPGRMSPNSALSFVLCGIAFTLLSFKNTSNVFYYIVLLLGKIILMMGALSMLGYAVHLPSTYQWAKLTPMSVPTALSFIIAGVGILTSVYSRHLSGEINLSKTSPYVAALFVLALTSLMWKASLQQETENIQGLVSLKGGEIKSAIRARIEDSISSLIRLGFQWHLYPNLPDKAGADFVDFYRKNKILRGLKSIEWMDSTFHRQGLTVLQGNESAFTIGSHHYSSLQEILKDAEKTREVRISRIINSTPQGPEFFIVVPLVEDSDFKGFIVGLMDIKEMLAGIFDDTKTSQFSFAIFEKRIPTKIFFRSSVKPYQDISSQQEMIYYNLQWIIKVWPTYAYIKAMENKFPSKIILFSGILIAFLLFFSIHMGQVAKSKTFQIHEKMKELQYFNDLIEALRDCSSLKKAVQPIAKYCKLLLPSTSGSVYFTDDTAKNLHPFSSWGGKPLKLNSFPLNACVALQQGKPYHLSNNSLHNLCEHLETERNHGFHLCLPLWDQDDILGLIQIHNYSSSDADPKNPFLLPETLARQLSLSISRLKLRDLLKNQVIHDPLTNLFNRRYLDEVFEREFQKAKRYSRPLSVLMIDIDYFKKINDTYGHEIGDEVLRSIGTFLLKNYRKTDIPCRFGGEEFIIVFPETPVEVAMKKAEELRQAVANFQINFQGKTIKGIRISIGISTFPQHAHSTKSLISSADAALYKAKEGGRNRLEVASPRSRKDKDKSA
ncbi:MAG: diguanylate cyclase [Alphaproteobacteria bacterium]|nr:diguanylate cyclase [Alphaproteobacteria bacterium]